MVPYEPEFAIRSALLPMSLYTSHFEATSSEGEIMSSGTLSPVRSRISNIDVSVYLSEFLNAMMMVSKGSCQSNVTFWGAVLGARGSVSELSVCFLLLQPASAARVTAAVIADNILAIFIVVSSRISIYDYFTTFDEPCQLIYYYSSNKKIM